MSSTTASTSSAGTWPASTSSGSTSAASSSAPSELSEASFLPIGYFSEKKKGANPAPIKNKVCLKKARQQGRYAKVHTYLDGIKRGLEILKVKKLSCCTKQQKEKINFEVDQILAKCAVIKEGVFGKKLTVQAMEEAASTTAS